MTRLTSSHPIEGVLPATESNDPSLQATDLLRDEFQKKAPAGLPAPHRIVVNRLLDVELLFFFLFLDFEIIELFFVFFAAGEEDLLFVLIRLLNFGLLGAVFLLLPGLRLVLARAHLRRLGGTADVAVLAGVLEERPLQHLPSAIETRHHCTDRAVE